MNNNNNNMNKEEPYIQQPQPICPEPQPQQAQEQPEAKNAISETITTTLTTTIIKDDKETLTWDIAEYGGYLFQKEKTQHSSHPQHYHHHNQMPLQYSQSQPQISPVRLQPPPQQTSLSDDESTSLPQQTQQQQQQQHYESGASTPLGLSHSNIRKPNFEDYCALIIANQKLPKKLVDFFWDKCSIKICADGGANRLYSLGTKIDQISRWVPDYIKGDLDSLHEGVADYFSKKGSTIVLDSNQDTSDLQKCFELIVDLEKSSGVRYKKIFILGGLGGSFSHEFANVNTLFDHPDRKIILSSKDNLAWLLSPSYNHNILSHTETKCSLIPLSSKTVEVNTTGLKWNLVKQSLNFGELISTSNVALENKITVETTNPLLFIVDINP